MLSRVVLTCLALCAALFAAPSTATTAPPASARCTIVGTAGADHLVGTDGRDVICGRGGDDTIDAGGGADVVRGGAGDDRIYGGTGADRLVGGPGDDVLNGSYGPDVLVGGPGDDDLLLGQAGPGPGHDYCVQAPRSACAGDESTLPVIRSLAISHDSVDVSTRARTVTIRARLTDDVGVAGVKIWLVGPRDVPGSTHTLSLPAVGAAFGHLVHGTARDGVWRHRIVVPEHQVPGDYRLDVRVLPRVGAEIRNEVDRHVVVSSTVSDQQPPVVVSMTRPRPGAQLSRSTRPLVSLRITDDIVGVALVWFCYRGVDQDPAQCTKGELAGGTERDGVWEGRMELADVDAGPGTFDIQTTDHAGRSSRWWGPAAWEQQQMPGVDLPGEYPLPGGYGDFVLME